VVGDTDTSVNPRLPTGEDVFLPHTVLELTPTTATDVPAVPAGVVHVIEVLDTDEGTIELPPNRTLVTFVNPVPFMVATCPPKLVPVVGAIDVN
jgi:hypothetical protein